MIEAVANFATSLNTLLRWLKCNGVIMDTMVSISTFFLAFACAALGFYVSYLLYYRDRTKDDQRQRELVRENEDVRHSLKLAHESHAKLDTRFARQTGQLKTLQALCDDWTESRRQADQERGELEEALRVKAQRLVDLQNNFTAEKQSRMELEDAQHRLHREFAASAAEAEETWRKKQAKADVAFGKLETQHASIQNDKKQLAKKLEAAEIQVAKLQSELANQQGLLATATNNAQGLEQEYISVESALADNNKQLQEAITKCATVESARQTAEAAIATLEQERDQLEIENERLAEQVIELEALKPQIDTLNETVQAATERLTVVVDQRDQAITAEATAKNVSSGLQQRIDNQEATIHRLRTKYEQVMEDLKQELNRRAQIESELQETMAVASERQTAAMTQLTNQRDQLADQLQAAEIETASLLKNHQQKIDSLVVEGDDLNSKYATICQESETLAQQCDELTLLCDERAALIMTLEGKNDEITTQISNLNEERDAFSTQIASLTSERDGLLGQLDQAEERLGATKVELTGQRKDLSAKIANLSSQQTQFSTQVESLTDERNALSGQIASLTSERDALLGQLDQTEERLGATKVELKAAHQTADELKTETEELKISCQRINELEALIQSRDVNRADLAEQLEKLRTAYEQAVATNKTIQTELEQLQGEWDSQLEIVSRNDNQIQILQNKLRASEGTIRSLRRERAAVLARLANYRTIAEPEAKVISFTEAMEIRNKRDHEYDNEYGGPVRMHATRGLVYTEAPKQQDDLKRISGIAVVLEARLNDYGIYTFKQIMEWTPAAIEEFSLLLTFKDRIERDDWISQARFFYNEKQRVGKSYAA